MLRIRIYYEPQEGWGIKEYYALHRYLHRMLFYDEKYSEEIAAIDLSRLTKETIALMYCIIRYYQKEYLYEQYENLRAVKNACPLSEPLVIDEPPYLNETAYEEMNVIY